MIVDSDVRSIIAHGKTSGQCESRLRVKKSHAGQVASAAEGLQYFDSGLIGEPWRLVRCVPQHEVAALQPAARGAEAERAVTGREAIQVERPA
jgi:hypothetical protein